MKYNKKDYIQISGDLFEEVQLKRIFRDSKTFVDSVPKKDPREILHQYRNLHADEIDLKTFVADNFEPPSDSTIKIDLPKDRTMEEHIGLLWNYLKRDKVNQSQNTTLISLPKPYIIPGGRFREIYYWDSYFTIHGLVISNEMEIAENMLDNFAFLIDEVDHIPNGNRVYYITRSQPPFFAAMINLLSKYNGVQWQLKYLQQLRKEYDFWMNKKNRLFELNENEFLNRYFDEDNLPREESYYEDFQLAAGFDENKQKEFYRNIRAACESGWDFSSRWFYDNENLTKCITTHIIPVDLNSLLYFTERKLAELYKLADNEIEEKKFLHASEKRKLLINKYNWKDNFYFDYNFMERKTTDIYSLAAVYPLYFGIASDEQAQYVADIIEKEFLRAGGLITTTNHTGQQWDAPNGWAPLQWLTIVGLRNYGFSKLADEIKNRWLKLNRDVFNRTGKMFEKYNVEDTTLFAGGGEYDLQDGFGWTNGIALALAKDLDLELN